MDLTKRQQEIFDFIKRYSARYGYPPPVRDIGKAVGLSEAAVRQRVQRLHESGIMQIVAVTAPLKLGFRRQAMIGVRVEGDVRLVRILLRCLLENAWKYSSLTLHARIEVAHAEANEMAWGDVAEDVFFG